MSDNNQTILTVDGQIVTAESFLRLHLLYKSYKLGMCKLYPYHTPVKIMSHQFPEKYHLNLHSFYRQFILFIIGIVLKQTKMSQCSSFEALQLWFLKECKTTYLPVLMTLQLQAVGVCAFNRRSIQSVGSGKATLLNTHGNIVGKCNAQTVSFSC